jgi:hypothetical protein
MDWTIMTLFELEMNLLQGPLGHLVPGINSFLLQSKVNYSHFSLAFVVPLWGCGWYVWDEWKFWYPWIHPTGRHEPLNRYVSLRVDCIFEGGIRTMRDWHKLAYSIGLPNHEL